jgi:23S rRNA pseudouridine1911/1915/1917 synthase
MEGHMTQYTYTITEEEAEQRLDTYLVAQFEDYSRNFIQQMIENGAVTIAEKAKKKNYRLKTGDVVEITISDPKILDVVAEDLPLTIVYEDDSILVIDKQAGMVVHPAPGNYSGTLVNALMYHVDRLSSINGVVRPGIVHRIDKDTSGLLVVAKTDQAHQFMSELLKTHEIERVYTALVHGKVKEPGTVNKPIARNPKNRLKMAVIEGGRDAVTHYKPLEYFGNDYTLLEVRLETGRTHQIRVHLQAVGYPILGDQVYGVKKEKIKQVRQLLHAKKLILEHPMTHEHMEFEVDLAEDFQKMIEKMRRIYGIQGADS